MRKYISLLLMLLALPFMTGCIYNEPVTEDIYFQGTVYVWDGAAWQPINGVAGGNVTSAGLLVNNTIIRGDGGGRGIQDSGITIDDFDGLDTNGGDITGFDIYAENDVNITNDLDVTDDATIGGLLDMTAGNIEDINQLNMTDPTELTINAGSITVTQGYHTVDTEGDNASDYLDTINGGNIGDIITLEGASDSREVVITRNGNIRFKLNHMLESFSFASPSGSSGVYYTGGYYAAPVASTTINQAAPAITYGTANSPYGSHAFLVASGAGTVNAGSCSIVVSGTSIANNGTAVIGDSETIVADITAMALNTYYQTTKSWLGTVTYTLTPAGAATYSATFNYGRAAYDSFDERLHTVKLFEVMGRAGASDAGFDIQLLHHRAAGWTYSAGAFMPGDGEICSLATDYGVASDLVAGERFKYEREVNRSIDGLDGVEGLLVRVTTTANKAVEFMDISIYVEAIPNDQHLKNTNQSITLMYNGTYWMER
jgi:hypothetical protein